MLIKVDFEKAYDYVSWDFLKSTLRRMGFGVRWCGWLEALVFSSSMSVLVNGILWWISKLLEGLDKGTSFPFSFPFGSEGICKFLWGILKIFILMIICMLICFNLRMVLSWLERVRGITFGPLKFHLEVLSWCRGFRWIYPKVVFLVLTLISIFCRRSLLFCLVVFVWSILCFLVVQWD